MGLYQPNNRGIKYEATRNAAKILYSIHKTNRFYFNNVELNKTGYSLKVIVSLMSRNGWINNKKEDSYHKNSWKLSESALIWLKSHA